MFKWWKRGAKQGDGRDPPEPPLFNVSVLMPESITIRMVDATVLEECAIWASAASALASMVTAFAVAYMQEFETKSASANLFGIVTLMFGFLFVIALTRTLVLSNRLMKTKRLIRMQVSTDKQPASG